MAEVIPEENLSEDYVISSFFDERIGHSGHYALKEAARKSGNPPS